MPGLRGAARIGLGVHIGHKVFGMPRVFDEFSMEHFAGHFTPVVKNVGAGWKGTCRTIVGFTLRR